MISHSEDPWASLEPHSQPTTSLIEAFEAFLVLYGALIEQLISAAIGQSDLLDDSDHDDIYIACLQRIWMTYFNGKRRYEHINEGKGKALVRDVVRSQVIDLIRAKHRERKQGMIDLDSYTTSTEMGSMPLIEVVSDGQCFTNVIDLSLDLEQAIHELVTKEEQLLVLRYYMGEVDRDVFSNYSSSFPEVTMHRIRKKLLKFFAENGW